MLEEGDEMGVVFVRCYACGYEGVTSEEPLVEADLADDSDVLAEPGNCPRCGAPIVDEEDVAEDEEEEAAGGPARERGGPRGITDYEP